MGLGSESIDKVIKELEQYKQSVLEREKLLLEKLREIGVQEATVRFTSASYDGVNDVEVYYDKTGNGYSIVASGEAVAFIEFGAGIYYNGSEPYPNPRPEGVVGIGEYGKGRGNRRSWYYKGEAGTNGVVQKNGAIKTRGNPAAMPMWYATEEMRKSILTIAREVFG